MIILGILFGDNISNNLAEYQALLLNLKALHIWAATNLDIKGNSQLVVHQLQNISRTLNPLMAYYFQQAHDLLFLFANLTLFFLPHHENTLAGSIACMSLLGSFSQNFDLTLIDSFPLSTFDP